MTSRKDMLSIPCDRIELRLNRHAANKHLPDILFLHGFLGNGRIFDKLIAELGNTANAITLDIGVYDQWGDMCYNNPLFTPAALSQALQKIPGDLFLSPPYIYAYSMGGRLALLEAVNQTPLFSQARALLLESTTAGMEDALQRSQRRKEDRTRAHALLADFQRFVLDWQQLPLFSVANKPASKHYTNLQRQIEPKEAYRWLLDFGTGSMPSLWSKLEHIDPPALLITGEHDLRFTQTARRMQQQLRHAVHVTIPSASHRVHADEPEKLAFEIARYINKLEPGFRHIM